MLGVMAVATEHPYVVTDRGILSGEPVLRGTRTPVRAVVEWWKFGAPPEEIISHLPHLSLAQVFDALSYFQDHQAQIEALIRQNRVPQRRRAARKR